MPGPIREIRCDGAQGAWTYRWAAPAADLAEHAAFLWDVGGTVRYCGQRILPTKDVVVIFDHLEPSNFGAFVCGLQQQAICVEPPARAFLTGVRLTPLGAFRALGVAAHEITEAITPLDDIVERGIAALRARVAETPDPADRLALVEAWLRSRLAQGPRLSAIAVGAWRFLAGLHGAVRVGEAAGAVGVTPRQLGRVFHEQIGLAPKAAGQLLRFDRALRLMGGRQRLSLAQVAAEAGYADQAHFAREFKSLAGATPSAYARGRLTGGDYGFMVETAD